MEKLDLTQVADLKKLYFYQAILIVIDAVRGFARRYADLAEAQAQTADDARKAESFWKWHAYCARCPTSRRRRCCEAVQSMWLIHLILQIESNGHSLSYGRLDQFLYPYYAADLESRAASPRTRPASCLTNLWLKTFTINKVRSLDAHTQFSAGSPAVSERVPSAVRRLTSKRRGQSAVLSRRCAALSQTTPDRSPT